MIESAQSLDSQVQCNRRSHIMKKSKMYKQCNASYEYTRIIPTELSTLYSLVSMYDIKPSPEMA